MVTNCTDALPSFLEVDYGSGVRVMSSNAARDIMLGGVINAVSNKKLSACNYKTIIVEILR